MRDWDKTIDELRKNIDDARKRWVLPFLDPSQYKTDTSKNKLKINEEENISTNEVLDSEKSKSDENQVDTAKEKVKVPSVEVEEKVEKVQKVDAAQVDAMLDEVKAEESTPVEVKEEKVEEVPKIEDEIIEEKKTSEKPKKGKKKVKEVKPDLVVKELADLEAINEDDLSEEQEERLMELRRIKTQRAMHEEVNEQFKSDMKQADEEIKTLKSQLKIKDPLPKGYVE